MIVEVHHIAGYNPRTQQAIFHSGRYEDCDECKRADEYWREQYGGQPIRRLNK